MGELKGDISPGAVHLCIDMQLLFSRQGPWPTPWMERVLPRVVRLVERAPPQTVFTRFLTPRSPADASGMWRAYYRKWPQTTRDKLDPALLELMPDLRRFVPPALVLDKLVYSAFAGGRLHAALRRRRVDTLIMTGSETDICVLASALAAIDHGYRLILAQDAICSSSDRAHDAMLELYHSRFDLQIELAAMDEIIEAWRP